MKRKLMVMMAMGTLAMTMMTGCGKSETNTVVTDEKIPMEETIPTGETLMFEDKVVASSVAVVEILDALGVPMIGVPTSVYDLPESVAEVTRIGNPMSPDIEVIASLEPTVVVSVDSLSAELSEQFELLGAESYFVNLTSYDGLKESIAKLGERFGMEEKANAMVAKFEAREAEITEATVSKEAPSVLILFGAGTSFMTVSENTYVGDLVKRVGGANIITDAPSSFSPVDMEYLADKNPEYILFMSHANPEESLAAFKQEIEGNPAWQNFDAVKNDKLITLETGYFGMSANLLAVDAMNKLVEILYEEN